MSAHRALAVVTIAATLAACDKDPLKSYPPELTTVKNNLESTFGNLDDLLNGSTARLSAMVGDTARERSELKGLFAASPSYILDYALISKAGILEIIEPPAYYSAEGSDISSQAHFIRILKDKEPAMSGTFITVEDFPAVVDIHPVLVEGVMEKALSALFKPYDLLDPAIRPLVDGQDFEIWVMEKGGTLIWDQDLPDIGRNLFTDPYYDPFPSLRVALDEIVADDYGETTYSFFKAETSTEVVKHAHWVTFSHHGQAWKIVHVTIER